MEQDNDIIDNQTSGGDPNLSAAAIGFLTETSKWAKFLSVMGFIGLGFMVLGGVFIMSMGNTMFGGASFRGGYSSMNPALFGLIYIAMAALYFFPVLYLYRFSTAVRDGLDMKNNDDITKGFENLKSHYKFIGIFTIIILSLYVLMFIGGIALAAFR